MSAEDRPSRQRRPQVKDMPIFTDSWVVARRPVGNEAFVAVLANNLGLRTIAVVKDGPKELLSKGVAPLSDWIVLSEYNTPVSRQAGPVTVYGGGGPMELTAERLLSLKTNREVHEARASVRYLVRESIRFVRALQATA